MTIAAVLQLADMVAGPPYQDFIRLAGQKSPGLAAIRGASSPRNWDIRAGYGITGAFVVFTGAGLAKFEVDIFAFEKAHFAAWKVFARRTLMAPSTGMRPTSMAIEHPQLNDPPLTILQVVVEDVTGWEQAPGDDGLWCRTIKFIQYRKAMPALIRPPEGPAGSPIAVAPPVDPEVRQIATNKVEIARLGAL